MSNLTACERTLSASGSLILTSTISCRSKFEILSNMRNARPALDEQRIAEAIVNDVIDTAADGSTPLTRLQAARDPRPVVAILQRHPDPAVRSWVAWAVPRLDLGDPISLLRVSAADRNTTVWSEAVAQLINLDPQVASDYSGKLRTMLQSPDYMEPVFALWTLASIGDTGAISHVAAYAESPDRDPWQRRLAEVILLILNGRQSEIVERLERHDHDYTPWLAQAAAKLGARGQEALARCAVEAPDEACRDECQARLAPNSVVRGQPPSSS